MHIVTTHRERLQASAGLASREPRGLYRTFPALQHRNFRLFWSGQLLSLIGTWMQTTGQSWLVLQLSHNPLALGTVGALQFLPILLFTLYGGVLADRLPKRRVLLFTQTFAAILALTLGTLVVTHTVQIWQIYILASLLGLNSALDMPTRQSFVVEMVGRGALPNAVALNSSVFNMAKIVGPGIAGLVIARFGEAPLFFGNAVSFIPVLIGLAMIDTSQLFRKTQAVAKASLSTFQSLRQGLDYVRKTPAVLLIILVVAVISLFGINFNVIEPLIATDLLHQGAQVFGLISASFGAGALIGALTIAFGNRKPSFKRMLISAMLFCVTLGLVGLSHWFLLTIALAIATGFSMITFTAAANTTLQTVTPDHLRGRVMSVYMLVFNGTTPFGNLLIGWLAGLIGISLALLIGASVSLVAATVGFLKRAPAEKNMKQALSFGD